MPPHLADLAAYIEKHELSQQQISLVMGKSRSHVNAVLTQHIKPTPEHIAKIMEYAQKIVSGEITIPEPKVVKEYRKLTNAERDKLMKYMRVNGLSETMVGQLVGISKSTFGAIKRQQTTTQVERIEMLMGFIDANKV